MSKREPALSRAELVRWKPGQSGNPGGISRVKREVRELAKANSVRAMQKIVDLIDAEDERIALAASIEVKNTAIGKPRVRDLTSEEIEREVDKRIAELTAKALEARRGIAIDVDGKEIQRPLRPDTTSTNANGSGDPPK